MSEIWKELEGFSKYKISNTGKIWSKSRNREMSLKPKEDGYICVGLINNIGDRIDMRIHRLVASIFISNPKNKQTVNHKNHNRADNRVENLEWATQSEQNDHKRKPSKEVTRLVNSRSVWRCSLDNERIEYYQTIKDAKEWVRKNTKYNKAGHQTISKVCQNKQKTTFGFKWVYDTSEENIFQNEIWKDIPKELVKGYTDYKISDQGRIKNPRGKILKGKKRSHGYRSVGIGSAVKKGTDYYIHRLVAQVFLPNFYNKPYVNHKDHDRSNCKLYNLEWVTPSENSIAAVNHYSSKK
tara:strand:- start:223 stop:1110 length:888 start_codon:yes stop_codon:yes gene_type:complete